MNRRLLWAAALVGGGHAAFSLYWALGGRALLDTVGPWAVTLAETRPLAAGMALTVVALLKMAAAVVPLMLDSGRLRSAGLWRRLCQAGALLLVLYGGVNAVVAWLVLGGVVTSSGGYDRTAMIGHAALWDPLFLVWGVLLLLGLRATRGWGRGTEDVSRDSVREPVAPAGQTEALARPD